MTILKEDKLSAELQMNAVQLKVGDMKVMSEYYQKALGLEVLGLESERVGLDAEIDVLGDESHRALRMILFQRDRQREDAVVRLVHRQVDG